MRQTTLDKRLSCPGQAKTTLADVPPSANNDEEDLNEVTGEFTELVCVRKRNVSESKQFSLTAPSTPGGEKDRNLLKRGTTASFAFRDFKNHGKRDGVTGSLTHVFPPASSKFYDCATWLARHQTAAGCARSISSLTGHSPRLLDSPASSCGANRKQPLAFIGERSCNIFLSPASDAILHEFASKLWRVGAATAHERVKTSYSPFTVTSNFSEDLLKFYFQDIPPLHANEAYPEFGGVGDKCSMYINENVRVGELRAKVLSLRRGDREYPEKSHRREASSSTIPTFENPGVNPPGIGPGSPWREASALATGPPLPQITRCKGRSTRQQRDTELVDTTAMKVRVERDDERLLAGARFVIAFVPPRQQYTSVAKRRILFGTARNTDVASARTQLNVSNNRLSGLHKVD
ncbi:hypothetical protein PR048_026389 [Dryococelus australis]|uniref:Uncharacterized protein n=1 Tax=Dryococelus australis TaxID=614101 RepID=A0ABQ9GL70_9NEOP|nr:hypothetical protein PR048_026389 [Dryococelus australis]